MKLGIYIQVKDQPNFSACLLGDLFDFITW